MTDVFHLKVNRFTKTNGDIELALSIHSRCKPNDLYEL